MNDDCSTKKVEFSSCLKAPRAYYHATNDEDGEYISWYEFTKEIYQQAGLDTEVLPVTTAEYGLSKAARPYNSRLDKSKLVKAGFRPLPKCDDFYHANDEGGLAWNDPAIGIEWPEVIGEYPGSASAAGYHLKDGSPLILSDKDQKWLGIKDTFKF